MTTPTRPYLVVGPNETVRIVRAATQAQALRHVAQHTFTVIPASANDVVEHMSNGVKPELAGEDPADGDDPK